MLLVCTPAPHLIRQLVPPERLARRLGLWSAYMPFGTALALLAGPGLILAAGWQVLWWLLSLFSALMAVWLWRVAPTDGALPSGNPNAAMWSLRLRQTLTSSGPWLVALCFAVYSAQWLAVIGFLPVVYAQAGVAVGATAWLTGLAAAVNIVGNVASGRYLSRGVRPQTLLFTGYTVMGIAAMLAFSQSATGVAHAVPPSVRYAAILLFSMVGGLVPGTLFALAVRFAPSHDTASTTVGWMQQGSALGQFVGPPLVAWVASRAGDWSQTWQVTGLFSLAGLLLTWRVGRRLAKADTVFTN